MSHVLHRTRATSYVYNQFYVHGDEDKSCLREHLRHFQQQHVGGHFFRCLADALSHSWRLSCTEPVTAGCSFKKKEEIKRNQSLPWWQHKQHVNETNLTSMLSFSNRRWVTSTGHSFWQTQWGRTGVEKKKKLHPWGRNKSVEDGYCGTNTVTTFPRKILILIASFSSNIWQSYHASFQSVKS